MIAYIQINSEGTPEFNPLKSLNEIIFISFNKDITAENLIEVEVDGDSGVLGGYYIDGVLYKNTIELASLKTNSKQLIEKHYDSSDYNIVRTKINDTDFLKIKENLCVFITNSWLKKFTSTRRCI